MLLLAIALASSTGAPRPPVETTFGTVDGATAYYFCTAENIVVARVTEVGSAAFSNLTPVVLEVEKVLHGSPRTSVTYGVPSGGRSPSRLVNPRPVLNTRYVLAFSEAPAHWDSHREGETVALAGVELSKNTNHLAKLQEWGPALRAELCRSTPRVNPSRR